MPRVISFYSENKKGSEKNVDEKKKIVIEIFSTGNKGTEPFPCWQSVCSLIPLELTLHSPPDVSSPLLETGLPELQCNSTPCLSSQGEQPGLSSLPQLPRYFGTVSLTEAFSLVGALRTGKTWDVWGQNQACQQSWAERTLTQCLCTPCQEAVSPNTPPVH